MLACKVRLTYIYVCVYIYIFFSFFLEVFLNKLQCARNRQCLQNSKYFSMAGTFRACMMRPGRNQIMKALDALLECRPYPEDGKKSMKAVK